MNFYEFVHTNFVFLRKTSNSFVRIREGFQHVRLRMACTVNDLKQHKIRKKHDKLQNLVTSTSPTGNPCDPSTLQSKDLTRWHENHIII